MQLLAIINQLLSADTEASLRELKARTYAVIPLSEKSGLIQWVDGATPLYSMYKQWQKRDSAAKQISKQNASNAAGKEALRPSDMYYSKMIPALKEKGITNVMSRKEWPLDVMRQVYLDLVRETPGHLFSKEMWSKTLTTLEWWTVSQTYNRSLAVMSIIGYIIGLGDRHLDNILLDVKTGEVVHIDYSIFLPVVLLPCAYFAKMYVLKRA
jgi:PI-3-kinase-related kinase SMG-1